MSVSRRDVLRGGAGIAAAAGLVGLAGCSAHGHNARRPESARTPRATPPAASRPDVVAAEQRLLGAYAATLNAHPQLTAILAVPIAHHRAHAAAFGGASTPASEGGAAPAVAADRAAALGALATLEQQAGTARQQEAITDTAVGGLLAAVGAAELVHVDLLARATGAIGAAGAAG